MVGVALLFATAESESDAGGIAALAAFAGGLIVGPWCTLAGQGKASKATADALDAVNTHNSILLNGRNPVPEAPEDRRSQAPPDTVLVREDMKTPILGGRALVTRRKSTFGNMLVFEGVLGVSRSPERGIDRMQIDCQKGLVFYIWTLSEGIFVGTILEVSTSAAYLEIRRM